MTKGVDSDLPGWQPKETRPNCRTTSGPTAKTTPLLRDAQKPWGGHPLCGRLPGYLPSKMFLSTSQDVHAGMTAHGMVFFQYWSVSPCHLGLHPTWDWQQASHGCHHPWSIGTRCGPHCPHSGTAGFLVVSRFKAHSRVGTPSIETRTTSASMWKWRNCTFFLSLQSSLSFSGTQCKSSSFTCVATLGSLAIAASGPPPLTPSRKDHALLVPARLATTVRCHSKHCAAQRPCPRTCRFYCCQR